MRNKSFIYALIIVLALGAGAYFWLWSIPGNMVGENEEEMVVMKEGLYQDNGLGFSFEYPADWDVHVEEKKAEKEREEQVAIVKNNARIVVDPLGRTGADEFYGDVIEREELEINGMVWSHIFLIESMYHRFVDLNEGIVLKEDASTDFKIPTKSEYSSIRREFRVHVYLEDVSSELQKEEALSVAKEVLETLKLNIN